MNNKALTYTNVDYPGWPVVKKAVLVYDNRIWGVSSVGRALRSQSEQEDFDNPLNDKKL